MNENEMTRMLVALKAVVPKYAPAEITKTHGVMWSNALREFSDNEIKEAFKYASENLTEFPAPANIKSLCLGQTKDSDEVGQEISSAIERCINKWGYNNWQNAKHEMGELAWKVVQSCGGWNELCNITYAQLPSCKKQWRELASSYHKGYVRDGHNRPHAIPGKTNIPDFLLE